VSEFRFQPARFIPYRDVEAIDRVLKIPMEKLTEHPNSDFRIEILPAAEIEFRWITDMFWRIKHAADAGEELTLILPQPYPGYRKLARLINQWRVDCRRLHTFNMDEYADEEGNIAPEDWPQSFGYALRRHLYSQIDRDLRPPADQMIGLTNKNLADYGKMIADRGGADVCYCGPGWTGHLAFIEPDAPEFAAASLEEWKTFGPRICTLSPFTIAQNSLHAAFGASGNLCAVPPKAATIGPAEVIGARHRIDMHAITVGGSPVAWQRVASRLVLHGPVTPRVPESILQTLRTDVWVSEAIAADIVNDPEGGY